MTNLKTLLIGLSTLFVATAMAQRGPYIGFAYPAGAQQGTTAQVRLGGQNLDDPLRVHVSGAGVTGKVVEFHRALANQEMTLLREQLAELRRAYRKPPGKEADTMATMSAESSMMMMSSEATQASGAPATDLASKIQDRLANFVNRPASAALATLVFVELQVDADASPGERELRVETTRGLSNPLYFHVGQLPEHLRKPMTTAPFQVLGKEQQALRKRPTNEAVLEVTLPCTVNGQIASGEVNKYNFEAKKGQRLVFSTMARQLVPFIADAVPGWFQPVLALHGPDGKEVAYADDYEFNPDPTILLEVPGDGRYTLSIYDAIYRGREDFVYRISMGELPFVTSVYPLAAKKDGAGSLKLAGWNLPKNGTPEVSEDAFGRCHVLVTNAGFKSNVRILSATTEGECLEIEDNDRPAKAQTVQLPATINGLIHAPGDTDIFKFAGKSNQAIVVEVIARRLASPMDSYLKLTDAKGNTIKFNDDQEDPFAGSNTHDADSYISATLPSDGMYYVHVGDTARSGGEDYAYRLRLGPPQPDFELRVVPSSLTINRRASATANVHLIRKDGFTGPVKIALREPPPGFAANPVTISGTQTVARVSIRTTLANTEQPVDLSLVGTASIDGAEVVHHAIAAEDRMQAFFWRHLVPATALKAVVVAPNATAIARKPLPDPSIMAASLTTTNLAGANKQFTKQQVAGRLRQLRTLYQAGLLTDEFYCVKVLECEAVDKQ